MGAIYRAMHRENKKVYIGQTIKPSWKDRYKGAEESRVRKLVERGTVSRPFEHAIAKHGWAAFEVKDLMTNVATETLDLLERFFIRQYQSDKQGFGYNADKGGNLRKEVSQETRRKIGDKHAMPTRWVHERLGEFYGSAAELTRKFPGAGLTTCALNRVFRGLDRHSKRSKRPEAPIRIAPRLFDVSVVWEHPATGRRFEGTAVALRDAFPGEGLNKYALGKLTPPNARNKQTFGWTISGRTRTRRLRVSKTLILSVRA